MVQETIEAVKKAEAEAEAEREKFKQEVSARNSRSELDYAREAEELMREAEREAGEEAAAMKDKAAEKTPEAVKLIIERLV